MEIGFFARCSCPLTLLGGRGISKTVLDFPPTYIEALTHGKTDSDDGTVPGSIPMDGGEAIGETQESFSRCHRAGSAGPISRAASGPGNRQGVTLGAVQF
jgi:hypothetical protein